MNIYDAALRYLGNRSRTVFEMNKYLTDKGFEAEDIQKFITEYKECGYLDDLRYCHEYMTYCYKKAKSKNRIAAELRQKGVDSLTIDRGFETYEEEVDEFQMAYDEALKVIGRMELTIDGRLPEKILGRIGRRLLTLGYSSDLVYNVIGKLMKG